MVIDGLEFAEACRVLEGTRAVSEFARLCQGLAASQDAEVQWRLAGRRDAGSGQLWLDVHAEGRVNVVCQRCLRPFSLPLRVDNTVGLVRTQAQLDAMDALEVEGEGPDVEYLVAERQMDVLALIEDELILVLPYAPRHEACPESDGQPADRPPAEASPFAVLGRLRKH
jgi:uncharacterized protein